MMLPTRPRKRSTRRGTTVVEFAFVAPIFFLVVFGIIEFGRALMVQGVLVNAARAGARAAIIPNETDAQVTTAVSTNMAGAGISGYTETLSPTLASSPASGTALTLTVSVPYANVSWYGYPTWLGGQSLSSSVSMIKE